MTMATTPSLIDLITNGRSNESQQNSSELHDESLFSESWNEGEYGGESGAKV